MRVIVIILMFLIKHLLSLDHNEILALQEIKAKWNITDWPGEPNCTTWSNHIQCNSLDNVVALEIGFAKPELLSGTILEAICRLKYLKKLALYGNRLSGLIPQCIGDLINLTYLDFSGNCLGGEIPASLGSLVNMVYFDLSVNAHNHFSFQHHELCNKSIENNGLIGNIPESLGNMNKVKYFYLSGNKLSGSIPETIGNLTSVIYIYINANNLSGNLPNSIGQLQNLQDLQLNKNMISGSIPEEIGNCSSLRIIQMNRNNISGFIPATIGNLAQLQALELLSNNIQGSIPEFKTTPVLDLNLFDVRLNNLSGPLPSSFKDAPLRYLFVSNNEYLEGVNNQLPSYIVPQFEFNSVIDEERHFDCPGYQLLSRTFQVTAPKVDLDPGYYNYSLCRCRTGYYGIPPNNCRRCLLNGQCPRIVNEKIEYGTMSFSNGMYPVTKDHQVVGFVQCSRYHYGKSPCNPNGDCFVGKYGLESPEGNCTLCEDGYEGRLCSKCICSSENYCFYHNNDECLRCEEISTSSKVAFIFGFLILMVVFAIFHSSTLFQVLLLVVMVIMVFVLNDSAWLTLNILVVFIVLLPATNTQSSVSGIIKIIIFYVQTLAIIMPTNVSNLVLRLMISRVGMSNLNFIGIACVFPQIFAISNHAILNHFIYSLCAPLLLFLFVILFLILKHFIKNLRQRYRSQRNTTIQPNKSLRHEILFTLMFIVYFSFFNASKLVISVFSFTEDPTGSSYLNDMKSIRYQSSDWYNLVIVSSIGAVIFLILPLLLFTILLYNYRSSYDTTHTLVWLGYLYRCYMPEENQILSKLRKVLWYYSEIVFMVYRFILAAILSIPDEKSVYKPVGILLVLFLGLALTSLKPFNSNIDNKASYMTMIMLIFTLFLAQTMTASANQSNIVFLEWLTIISNSLYLITLAIITLWLEKENIVGNIKNIITFIMNTIVLVRTRLHGVRDQQLVTH